jgi:hypothetical protein
VRAERSGEGGRLGVVDSMFLFWLERGRQCDEALSKDEAESMSSS